MKGGGYRGFLIRKTMRKRD